MQHATTCRNSAKKSCCSLLEMCFQVLRSELQLTHQLGITIHRNHDRIAVPESDEPTSGAAGAAELRQDSSVSWEHVAGVRKKRTEKLIKDWNSRRGTLSHRAPAIDSLRRLEAHE